MEDLTAAMREVKGEAAALRRAFNRRTIALVAIALAMVAVVAIASRVQAENEARIRELTAQIEASNDRRLAENNALFCPLVQAIKLQPGDPKPNVRGERLIDWAAVMRTKFRCPTDGA